MPRLPEVRAHPSIGFAEDRCDDLGSHVAPDEQNIGAPLSGLGAADGMLFVPDGTSLYAY